MSDLIVIERPHEHVALVRLNRPKVLNALSNALAKQLAETLERLDADGVTRAVVLTGDDRAFAAGADIAEIAAEGPRLEEWDRLWATGLPIVAAVRVVGDDHQVARHRELESAAERDAAHRRDDRQPGRPPTIPFFEPRTFGRDLGDIGPGREGPVVAGEHDRARDAVGIQPLQRLGELLRERVRERVQYLRAVQPNERDVL